MRKLYNKQDEQRLPSSSRSFVFTEETYRELLSQIDSLREELAADEIDLEAFKDAIEQAVNTVTLTSENVNTTILNATRAVLSHLTVEDITAPDANITRLIADAITGDTAAVRALTSTDITSTNATIDNLNATEATVGTLNTTTFNPSSVNTSDLTATNATITNETVADSTITNATISEADIAKADVVELEADKADIVEAEISQLYSEKLNTHYITHKELYNRQVVSTSSTAADGEYWIVVPKFLNGNYNIIATTDTNVILWSLELLNSTKNCAFRWSISSPEGAPAYEYIKYVDIVKDAASDQEFFQIELNTNGLATYIYSYCNSYKTEEPLSIYAIKKYEPEEQLKHFQVNRAAGTWLPNSVFAGEFHADSMIIDETVFERITLNHDLNLPTAYDQYGNPINYTTGTPGQYVTPVLDEYDHTGIQWKDPVDNRTPTDAQETIDLISQATLGNYTGKMVAEKISESITEYADILTDATQSIKIVDTFYPITDKQQLPAYRDEYAITDYSQEDLDALVDAGLFLKDGSTDPATYTQISVIDVENKTIDGVDYSADWGNLKAYSDEHAGYDQIKYNNGWHTVTYPFDVWVANGEEYNIVHTGDGTEVHGDATIDNDLDVKRDAHIERDAVIDRDLNVSRNTSIGGDLTVESTYIDPDTSVTKLNKVKLPNIYNGENAPTMPDGSLVIELNRTSGTHTEIRQYIRNSSATPTLWYTYPGVVPTDASTGTFDHASTFDWPVVIIPYDNVYHNVVSEHKWYDINGNEVTDQDKIDELDAAPRTNHASRAWYNEEIPTAVPTTLERVKDVTAGGVVTKRRDEIAAYKSDSDKLVAAKDGQPMVWRDETRTIEPADELKLDDLEVDDLKVNNNAEVVNDLKVGADVMIGGDLHVTGKAYIDDVIEQQTEGNFLTLRANSQTAMTSQELSGVLINNTDGQGNIVAVVSDANGTIRTGDVTGTRTTYAELYLVVSTGKYYTDDTYTTEVSPTGTLIKWDTYKKIEDETLGTIEAWTNAIFVTISSLNPDLEPLATRKETADMNDQGLVKWNSTGEKLDTLPLPTINGQKLVATVTPDPLDPSADPTITYGWGGTQEPSTFIFDTVEDYEAALLIPEGQAGYIPSKSHIIIRGNYDNILGV